jgi:hydrogenase-4 component B
MSESLLLLAIALAASSGAVGLLFGRRSRGGQWLATVIAVLGSAAGLAGVGVFWAGAGQAGKPDVLICLPWSVPGGQFLVGIDAISAVFLLPVFLVSLLGSVYGLSYWKQTEHPENGRKLRLFYGTLTAGMALLVIARNGVLFLFGWEIMALSGFFLVTTDDRVREVRRSGWIYLVATHAAALFLFALFGLLRKATGSFTLAPLDAAALAPGMATAIFVCALAGFGLKAGIMPLHVWLPGAHANAPSHVSAIMSGVILKMGIYGLVRVLALLPTPPLAWGYTVLGLGVVSGVLGVAFAVGQHDLKRLLAYHSIENIGIIVMGLGLALLGRTLGRADWIVLGLGGALLHVWNHALFKSLLFFSAGSVLHATGSRQIDRLGGLAKTMPRTALAFLVGAIAICGLPPLNGFVSELLIYLGLFGTLGIGAGAACPIAAFAAPALALIGALAVACFVKVFGAVFLGSARSEDAMHAHESPWSMIGPMGVLMAGCGFIGLFPALVAPLLGRAIAAWSPETADAGSRLATLAPLDWISGMGLLLLVLLGLGSAVLWLRLRASDLATGSTWGCGYAAPTARMQYTSSSFAQMLVGLFAWALRPQVRQAFQPDKLGQARKPDVQTTPLFPKKTAFHSHVPDSVLDRAVLPSFRLAARLLSWFHVFHQGSIQTYLLYIFLTLVALLLWR